MSSRTADSPRKVAPSLGDPQAFRLRRFSRRLKIRMATRVAGVRTPTGMWGRPRAHTALHRPSTSSRWTHPRERRAPVRRSPDIPWTSGHSGGRTRLDPILPRPFHWPVWQDVQVPPASPTPTSRAGGRDPTPGLGEPPQRRFFRGLPGGSTSTLQKHMPNTRQDLEFPGWCSCFHWFRMRPQARGRSCAVRQEEAGVHLLLPDPKSPPFPGAQGNPL